jgi:pimeloyl-ACP methyl ester carboxylesterase
MYASIHGLQLFYEVHGTGRPLMLLHGGGSTIESTFGRILPALAAHHRVVAVELQAHGRTPDIDRPLTFEQDADDAAALLGHLGIAQADVMGFSNGGTTALQMAIRHPRLLRKLVLISALYRRDGMVDGFWDGMQKASLDVMPIPLAEAFLKVNPDRAGLQRMFDRDKARMLAFTDIDEGELRLVQAPALIVNGDADVVRTEHAVALSRLLPHGRLAILPGRHGEAVGEVTCEDDPRLRLFVSAVIDRFLEE